MKKKWLECRFEKLISGFDSQIIKILPDIKKPEGKRIYAAWTMVDNEGTGITDKNYLFPIISILFPRKGMQGRINPNKKLWDEFFVGDFIKPSEVKSLFEKQFLVRYGLEGFDIYPV
jgi:hypothetical protein